MTYFAMREYGIAPNGWLNFAGRWVVRNTAFEFVDCDRYRGDLQDRYEGMVIIDRRTDKINEVSN
jgi:hypothetical protein|tara:strand:+ start:518 stop:712 length:195 start_codon:yes stop_codon:yes gene_type:complete